MQRSTMPTRDPWDKPVRIPDHQATVTRQLLPKCPLPTMKNTSRLQTGDALSVPRWAFDQGDIKGSNKGADSPILRKQNIFRNFRKSTEPFYSNARSVSLSPMKAAEQMRRKSDFRPNPRLYPRLPPRAPSLDSQDSRKDDVWNVTRRVQQRLPVRASSLGGQHADNLHNTRTPSNVVTTSSWGGDNMVKTDNCFAASPVHIDETFNSAREMAEEHRRRRNARWEERLRATSEATRDELEVTSPPTDRKVQTNFTSDTVEQCLRDQHRRNMDCIPSHVDVSNISSSTVDGNDDDITFCTRVSSAPIVVKNFPSSSAKSGGDWPPAPPSREAEPKPEHRRRRSCSTKDSPVPSSLDKAYLKNLAARHRSSVCGTLASRSSVSNGEVSNQNDNCTRSNAPLVTPPESPSYQHQGASYSSDTSSVYRQPAFPTQGAYPSREFVSPTKTLPQPPQVVMVEICPGLVAPLRGYHETRKAVANRFYVTNVHCFGCGTDICCIADAQYTICPRCRVISPVEDYTFKGKTLFSRWGLGLGFTQENLSDMQAEIAAVVFT